MQACDDQPELSKPTKGGAFKAQANGLNEEAAKPAKKKNKKAKKTAKKKAKPSVAD
jgi:hypothetical protein